MEKPLLLSHFVSDAQPWEIFAQLIQVHRAILTVAIRQLPAVGVHFQIVKQGNLPLSASLVAAGIHYSDAQ